MWNGLERIKDALVLEILFPVRVVTPDFAKKEDTSSSRIFPFVYFSKAKRTIRDFFFSTTVVQISHRCLAWEYSHSHFLAKSAFRIFGKRIYIVFALPESHIEHKFPLTSVITPESGKFNARKFPCVEEINNLSTVHRIAGQAIGIPCKDVSAESFNF